MGKENDGLMKIGELAQAAGVSVSAAKFYVKEGFIRPAVKTGRNMAYYDPSCVEVIQTVRTLQRDRFYPLSVIKRLLDAPPEKGDMVLLDAIVKAELPATEAPVSRAEAVRRTGLTAAQITALEEAGLLSPTGGRSKAYRTSDLAVMGLIRRRLDAGIPFQQSVRSFCIYEKALQQAVAQDVEALAQVLPAATFTAETGAQMIRTSDETLDTYVILRRKELNRKFGSERLQDLDRFQSALQKALAALVDILDESGFQRDAAFLAELLAEDSCAGALAEHCWGFAHSGSDTAQCIAGAARGREFFKDLVPQGQRRLSLHLIKATWLTLAPGVLCCADAAKTAMAQLQEYLDIQNQEALAAAIGRVLS